ncbi:YT521-B-like domain-containing protein [Elsinoe ampelina]|uniref:YT521-B-like domain-containing protein n=1 Tax=Elsinoe ampelina TaxID=302913 RepID=A0A6A6G910_9PEZI|nr:YT521-B-like domain-containing protein [Elsinoe ampelina]
MPANAPFLPVGTPHYGTIHHSRQILYAISNNFRAGLDTTKPTLEPTPSYPRGPPRKPKQSGFAVWVGNLSPGTTILDLKDYFSRGATNDIESVFLVSKSNCAFVNYKTAESAQSAVSRFHDSRFNGARLVCRLRHGQAPTTTTPPLAVNRNLSPISAPTTDNASPATAAPNEGQLPHRDFDTKTSAPSVDRYFVVKSLTLQDLEASVRDGIWATQSHNETALKEAFESAQDVYLIFSANKSGEYFGYARMKSNINPSAVTANPKAEPSTPASVDGPTSTPTPATQHAPKGKVVDDSARGTIFWEADSSSESDAEKDEADGIDGSHEASTERAPSRPSEKKRSTSDDPAKQDWGRPFEIEWLSTSRLPFYRTRGIRNPWNANREVKIARDGTELEPSVGRRLLDLFQQSIHNPTTTSSITYQMPEGPVVAMGSAYTGPDHGRSSS